METFVATIGATTGTISMWSARHNEYHERAPPLERTATFAGHPRGAQCVTSFRPTGQEYPVFVSGASMASGAGTWRDPSYGYRLTTCITSPLSSSTGPLPECLRATPSATCGRSARLTANPASHGSWSEMMASRDTAALPHLRRSRMASGSTLSVVVPMAGCAAGPPKTAARCCGPCDTGIPAALCGWERRRMTGMVLSSSVRVLMAASLCGIHIVASRGSCGTLGVRCARRRPWNWMDSHTCSCTPKTVGRTSRPLANSSSVAAPRSQPSSTRGWHARAWSAADDMWRMRRPAGWGMQLWSPPEPAHLRLRGLPEDVRSVVLTGDGKYIAGCGPDYVHFWDAETGLQVAGGRERGVAAHLRRARY